MHFYHHVCFRTMVILFVSVLIKVPSDEKRTRSSEEEFGFLRECENSTLRNENCEVGVL